jgi:hypothetical protein
VFRMLATHVWRTHEVWADESGGPTFFAGKPPLRISVVPAVQQ